MDLCFFLVLRKSGPDGWDAISPKDSEVKSITVNAGSIMDAQNQRSVSAKNQEEKNSKWCCSLFARKS